MVVLCTTQQEESISVEEVVLEKETLKVAEIGLPEEVMAVESSYFKATAR